MKKILYSVAALALLLVAAAVVAPIAVDEEQIKARIGAEVAAATGRELVIDGHLDLALLPRPRISLGGLRLANLEGASARHMVSLKGLEASVALVPLLTGEIEVTSLRLIEPVIELERLADGRANWVLGGRAGGSKRMGWVGISVDRLDIE
ncbi:MAG: AsmA family protein, partial [Alphaproteobacteria bacterium]